MTVSPGDFERTAATNASALSITRSSSLVTTAPLGRPADAAGPPLTTSTTRAPCVFASLVTRTPSDACDALPVAISWSAMRLAWSTGIAKPSPIDPALASGPALSPSVAIAEFTPISSPFMFTSAPPELPGLIAASVWMASSTVFWLSASPTVDTGRFSALMMPAVTVLSSPSGDPTATTLCPTRRSADEPIVIAVNPDMSFARMTAMSLIGSAPTIVNDAMRPSLNVAVVSAPDSPSGPAPGTDTTWLFVRISPSGSRTMPEPSAVARPSLVSNFTTLGTTLAATSSTEPGCTLAGGGVPLFAVVMVLMRE